jgi:hypothetical protein
MHQKQYISRVYNVAAILWLQYMVHVMLFPMINVGLAMGWTVRGLNSDGTEIFHTHSDWSWGSPSLLYSGYHVFRVGKVPGAWCRSPTPSSTEVKERVEVHLYSTSVTLWHVIG